MDNINKNRNSSLLDEWNYKLDQSTLSKLKKCKTLYYPGAFYDFSTLQFFMENSGVTDFYYVDHDYNEYNTIIKNKLFEHLWKYDDYQIIEQEDLYPNHFNLYNWDKFWYKNKSYSEIDKISFIKKITIKKEEQNWNLFLFRTEGISTLEILLKNRIKMDILVDTSAQTGFWKDFSLKTLIEEIFLKKRDYPKMILHYDDLKFTNYIPCMSETFGKFGTYNTDKRKLFYLKK